MTVLTELKKAHQSNFQVRFQPLQKGSPQLFDLLKTNFAEKIAPLYGDQTEIIKKTTDGHDRSCEFLFYQDKPSGVIIYKNDPSDEFIEFGAGNAIELKTILLIQKNTKTAGIFLKHLLTRVANQAVQTEAECIFGTVSSKKPEVLRVLCKLGFNVVTCFHGKYIEGVDEYLICHPSPYDLLIKNESSRSVSKPGILLCPNA